MKQFIILLLCFTFCSCLLFAQNEKDYNSIVKMECTKAIYLNATWKVVADKKDAVYMRFVHTSYNSKEDMEMYFKDKKRLEVIGKKPIKTKDGIIVLNGDYYWYDKKDRLLTHNKYENGIRIFEKSYRWPIWIGKDKDPKVHEYFDFRQKYYNQPNSIYYELYDRKGNKSKFYLRNGVKGIAYYPIVK